MFREMRRFKQALSREECIELLTREVRGVLSVAGDDGYPYGVPHNHYYCPEDGKLYFHSGMQGHKIDSILRCSKASYCVYDQGYRRESDWALYIRSVIVFGRIELIEDRDRIYEISRALSYKFTDDEEYIRREIEKSGPRTLMFALVPEHISGKLVHEA